MYAYAHNVCARAGVDKMAKTGRPIEPLDQKMADIICDLIATNTKGLRKICAEYEDLPCEFTINTWRLKHPSFAAQFARAKLVQADLLAEEILEISDDGTNDTYINEDGYEATNHDVLGRSKLRIDSRKWLASKLLPKAYGDRQQDDSTAQNTLIEKLLEKL